MYKIYLLVFSILFPAARQAYGSSKNTNTDGFSVAVEAATETVSQIWLNFLGHIPYLVVGLIVIVLTWVNARIVGKLSLRLLKNTRLRGSLKSLISRFSVIGVWVLGILIAAMIVFPGLTPSKALGAMGIASVAVGFAFKDIFENFLAGVLLLWRFPFEVDDYIECESIKGKVEDVSIRMTQIRKTDDELVVLPNSFLFKNLDIR